LAVAITAEDALGAYPWRPKDLRRALRERYADFKENQKFFQILRPLEGKRSFCETRVLDPRNPKSAKQKCYNPNIVQAFDPHYIRA